MICAIHQPQTFPYLGYFAKMVQADCFVYLDNVQFKKNEWQNRNKIKTTDGWQWLTVPVIHHFGQKINEVAINSTSNWQDKHRQALRTYYAKAPYFKTYFRELESIYARQWTNLCAFNLATLQWLRDCLGITTPTYIASAIPILQEKPEITPDERLILICKALGADTYLSGAGGHDYLETERFPQNSITLLFQNFKHPVYPQLHGDFLPYLSVLDLLFNAGPDSLTIIKQGIQ